MGLRVIFARRRVSLDQFWWQVDKRHMAYHDRFVVWLTVLQQQYNFHVSPDFVLVNSPDQVKSRNSVITPSEGVKWDWGRYEYAFSTVKPSYLRNSAQITRHMRFDWCWNQWLWKAWMALDGHYVLDYTRFFGPTPFELHPTWFCKKN